MIRRAAVCLLFACITLPLAQGAAYQQGRLHTTIDSDFPVTVGGGHFRAGTYFVPPAFRVYDVLALSTDTLRLWQVPRALMVDGAPLDLLRYLCCQDISQNPVVRPGMSIVASYPTRFVFVNGDLQGPLMGKVPMKSGETIRSVLGLFTLNASADSSAVVVVRDSSRLLVESARWDTFELAHNDYLFVSVKRATRAPAMVWVRGEVLRPGVQTITPGVTRVRDVIDSAGRSPTADPARAFVYRKLIDTSGAQSPRPEVNAAIRNAFASGDYETICADALDRTLNDSDIVEVPLVARTVSVSGYVEHPGVYPWVANEGARHYVRSAGGYTRAADRGNVRVITPCGHTYQLRDAGSIAAGDIIMVPEEQEAKWVRVWLPVIQVIASTLTIVVALINVAN